MRRVAIHGGGVAAHCCAHLLRAAGFGIELHRAGTAQIPALLLSPATQVLLRDVYGHPNLLHEAPQIRQRIVSWGPQAQTLRLEHSAVVASEESLLGMIREDATAADAGVADTTIFASRPLPGGPAEHRFGSRTAAIVAARGAARDACWIESLEQGWLFLIPGWLIAVGDAPGALLAHSRLIAREVAELCGEARTFRSEPRIAWPLHGAGWLACGSAALAFDPICGDGTGHAVREAILAAAVLRAGGSAELLAHYENRLVAGLMRHLSICHQFYSSGGPGDWWSEQVRATDQGLSWCREKLAGMPPLRYHLRGFDLHLIEDR